MTELTHRPPKDTKVTDIRSDEHETIIAAALGVENLGIFIGRRHADAFRRLHNKHEDLYGGNIEQWFLTSENRFVDRYEARDIAEAAGQCDAQHVLFSEDLR